MGDPITRDESLALAAEVLEPVWQLPIRDACDVLAFAFRIWCDSSASYEREEWGTRTVADAVRSLNARSGEEAA